MSFQPQVHLQPTTSINPPLDQSNGKGKSCCPSRPDGVLMHSTTLSAASSSHSSARLEKTASLARVAGNCPHVPPAGIKLMFRLHLSKLWRAAGGFFKAGGTGRGRGVFWEAGNTCEFPPFCPPTDNIFQSEQLVW